MYFKIKTIAVLKKSYLLTMIFLISGLVAGCVSDSSEEEAELLQKTTAVQFEERTSTVAFAPSLGINTSSPQPEAGSPSVGLAVPFVDLFRIARPFKELSKGITVDQSGWPTSIEEGGKVRTKFLIGTVPEGSIPVGDYTVLYEGHGDIGFSGNVITTPLPDSMKNQGFQGRMISIESGVSEVNLYVSGIEAGEGNYITNIRVIMPGGTCEGVNHLWVADESSCSSSQPFSSFVDRLKNDRDMIIFNPDYLNFLKDFNTVRMMNLMEASPGDSTCQDNLKQLIESCVTQVDTWDERALLSDAVWGGSDLTSLSTKVGVYNRVSRKGVPVEVAVELANQANVNPWFNMPHAADDNYIRLFAEYVSEHLNSHLRTYIEYSNEIWNSGFIGHHYVELKGNELGFDTVPDEFINYTARGADYFSRLRYYSKRSVEIFDLWEAAFSGKERLIRVMGAQIGDKVRSEKTLEFENAVGRSKVDALAIAPYFSGCVDRSSDLCAGAPKVMTEAETVDDLFEIIDWESSTNGLSGTIRKIELQAGVASEYKVQLLAYEGGQHFTAVDGALGVFSNDEKLRIRGLISDANNDPRMKQRYLDLLNDWQSKMSGVTTLFTLYSMPQMPYEYGNWGLKEYLSQPRSEAPKYDAAMTFQESMLGPWWDDTIPVDSDGDGVYDRDDEFPDDRSEWLDTDLDGIGNNSDTDDDNDGMPDAWELEYGLDPLDASDATMDADGDNVTNLNEYLAQTNPALQDSDGDGITDDLDEVNGSGLWGYACNVVNDPNSDTRRWGINQYDAAELPNAVTEPVYSMGKNRTIQSVACDPAGDNILFSMKDSVQGDYEIYELEVTSGLITQITDNDTDDVDVTRSRDGLTVAWQKRLPDDRQALELRQYQENGEFTEITLASANPFVQPSLSPNGEWLTFVQLRPSSFAVMRYDILNAAYTEVRVIARRKKLYHPSITDDGNKVGWSERTSMLRYRVKDLAENITTDVIYEVNGVEHAVLSGDGRHVIYSVNTPSHAQAYLMEIDTSDTTIIGETLTNSIRYLSNNWLGSVRSSGFELNQVTGRHLRSLNQSMTFWFRNNGSGVRYTSDTDEVAFTWELDDGVVTIREPGANLAWVIQLLAAAGGQYSVSIISSDGRGGVARQMDTLYREETIVQ